MLKDLLDRGIQPEEKSVAKVLDIFLLKQFLTNLGGETPKWGRRHQPQSNENTLHLAKAFAAVKQEPGQEKTGKNGSVTLKECEDSGG